MPVLKIKKNGSWVEVWGSLNGDADDGASAPRLTSVTIAASEWNGTSSPYSQVVACNCVSANSKIDLQPDPFQLIELQEAEISLVAANDNGMVSIYAIGGKPAVDMTMQALITEVSVI